MDLCNALGPKFQQSKDSSDCTLLDQVERNENSPEVCKNNGPKPLKIAILLGSR